MFYLEFKKTLSAGANTSPSAQQKAVKDTTADTCWLIKVQKNYKVSPQVHWLKNTSVTLIDSAVQSISKK